MLRISLIFCRFATFATPSKPSLKMTGGKGGKGGKIQGFATTSPVLSKNQLFPEFLLQSISHRTMNCEITGKSRAISALSQFMVLWLMDWSDNSGIFAPIHKPQNHESRNCGKNPAISQFIVLWLHQRSAGCWLARSSATGRGSRASLMSTPAFPLRISPYIY